MLKFGVSVVISSNKTTMKFASIDSSFLLRASLIVQLVKNLPATQETPVRSLGRENPLEKGKATHSSILAWEFHDCIVHGVAELDTTERLSLSLSVQCLLGSPRAPR